MSGRASVRVVKMLENGCHHHLEFGKQEICIDYIVFFIEI